MPKLPLANSMKQYYNDSNTLVIVQTARAKKWWLPLLLFIRGIRYDYLIQRPKTNNSDSATLKKTQLVDFLMRHKEIKNPFIGFVDDNKANRDSIQTMKNAHVYDADYFNNLKGDL